ncbi:bifunctional cobalt-precorrin-7 (C(5))-methyltransferase/cobalt-precorrin-6B (C(15))-methyltransferase [Massilibacterium senegalense]|uniref:bifunctional cobalt-precorrin-7 (C(5))-methyltransferase/cobalt-precorrin-6B (C(15))-methyltransferase n=1 Tax=Massilibacterium senegalense TaxID=1632858 RepID=UPI000781EDE0|nr:bifunctional cobalt-precorrin-7 (C(5))-methyltransferase/cobalt-precorrin-6B (C(15))-methyltransferase [Massilibacterium senegalense]
MAKSVKVIGIQDSGIESLLPLYQSFIKNSTMLVGGERQLAFFPDYHSEKVIIKGGLKQVIEKMKDHDGDVVVLASGDPLFYGIGGYLADKLQAEIYPSLSSIQLAFSKMKEKWQDATFLSVHGRPLKGLAQKIDEKKLVAILTDEENTPSAIATYLQTFHMTEYEAFVGEDLGGKDEKVGFYTLDEMKNTAFHPLNVMILKQITPGPTWHLGIPDEEFSQRKPDKGLITKREIRVLSLANLRLKEDSIVWDIGTCTGSMAIEAQRIARNGEVFAIEKNEADIENCKLNMRKFRTDFTVVHGKAPDRLDEFKDPDAIFMGGTGGNLRDLISYCTGRLKKDGTIVINAVTIDNFTDAFSILKEAGFKVDVGLYQVSRSKPILHMTRFEALNPIYSITAVKEAEHE